jgi:hypothetical protein
LDEFRADREDDDRFEVEGGDVDIGAILGAAASGGGWSREDSCGVISVTT